MEDAPAFCIFLRGKVFAMSAASTYKRGDAVSVSNRR
jgi:hypothetical protein